MAAKTKTKASGEDDAAAKADDAVTEDGVKLETAAEADETKAGKDGAGKDGAGKDKAEAAEEDTAEEVDDEAQADEEDDEPAEPKAAKPKSAAKTKAAAKSKPTSKAASGTKAKSEDDEDDDEEDDEDGDDAPRARRGLPGGRALGGAVVLKAVFVIVLLASVVTAGLQWYRADQAAAREATRNEVKARAGEFGQALLSYDHRSLQAARKRVLAMASEDFAKTYDVAFTGGLESVITRLKADATASVRTVYLGDVDESSARAIVVMDSEVRSSAGTRRVLGSHLDMRLERKGGTWRITEVTSIGAADESMTDPDGKKQGGTTPAVPAPSPSSGD